HLFGSATNAPRVVLFVPCTQAQLTLDLRHGTDQNQIWSVCPSAAGISPGTQYDLVKCLRSARGHTRVRWPLHGEALQRRLCARQVHGSASQAAQHFPAQNRQLEQRARNRAVMTLVVNDAVGGQQRVELCVPAILAPDMDEDGL